MSQQTSAPSEPDAESIQIAALLHEQNPLVFNRLLVYAEPLSRTLARKYPFLSKEDIEDIVHDTFIQAYCKGKNYDPTRMKIKSWLTMMAYYRALTLGRQRRNLSSQSIHSVEDKVSADFTVTASINEEEPSDPMTSYLKALSRQRAAVIWLYYYEQESVSNIAKQLAITEGSVRSHRTRALEDLRRLITYKTEANKNL